MIRALSQFLHLHWDPKQPLLLGFSGGPDSKALLYGLLDAGCSRIHLAHVDHGWRLESASEALQLEAEANHLGLPFHSIRLAPSTSGNPEAVAREARLAFFRSLCREAGPFQAVLLAHHADDVAETVLKRVFEGAHLPFLGGMEPVTSQEDLTIWRPLLYVRRKEILAFLKRKQLSCLEDPTNRDPAYLRARMRQELLPMLSDCFGKEISGSLALLSQRVFEYRSYLDQRIAHCQGSRGPWGVFYWAGDLHPVEVRYLLQVKGREERLSWPRALLEDMVEAIVSKRPNCRFSPEVFIDRGHLFFSQTLLQN